MSVTILYRKKKVKTSVVTVLNTTTQFARGLNVRGDTLYWKKNRAGKVRHILRLMYRVRNYIIVVLLSTEF